MAVNEAWGDRLRRAKSDLENRKRGGRRISFREIGERVAALVGREEPYSSTAARAWFMEGQEPDSFAVAYAIEAVLEVPRGALILEPAAPSSDSALPADNFGLARDPEVSVQDRLEQIAPAAKQAVAGGKPPRLGKGK